MMSVDDSKSVSQGQYNRSNFTRQMRRSITKMKESIQKITEFSAIDEEPLHVLPESLDKLCEITGFTKSQIRKLYQNFKQYCPTGAIRLNDFRLIYAKLFPLGNSRKYAGLVFNNFDHDADGIVSFNDLLISMASIVKGNNNDKLSWIFRFYDIDGDGYITKQEMTIVVSAIYEMIHRYRINDCINHVERIFHKMDINKDGVISQEEFMITCKKVINCILTKKQFRRILLKL